MPVKSKAKGNAFEIKLAKALSTWMFDNPNILWRDSTSGGRKVIYNGDIIPSQVDQYPWSTWPFIIEAKHGYKEHIPTLMNQTKVRFWLSKLLGERTDKQFIPIFIAQFHNCHPILITTMLLNVYCDLCMKVIDSTETWYDFYVYDYKSVLQVPFKEAVPQYVLDNLELE